MSAAVVLPVVFIVTGPLPPLGGVPPDTSAGELIVGLNDTAARAPVDAVMELLVVSRVVATVKFVSTPIPYVPLDS
jgi:fumarate reductase subunit D